MHVVESTYVLCDGESVTFVGPQREGLSLLLPELAEPFLQLASSAAPMVCVVTLNCMH